MVQKESEIYCDICGGKVVKEEAVELIMRTRRGNDSENRYFIRDYCLECRTKVQRELEKMEK
jgi:hypothetical protein